MRAGIVKIADTKSVMPVEAADVVIRAVYYFLDGASCQNLFERREFTERYGIDDVDFTISGDLNQTKLFRVTVAAVGLGIQGDGC